MAGLSISFVFLMLTFFSCQLCFFFFLLLAYHEIKDDLKHTDAHAYNDLP